MVSLEWQQDYRNFSRIVRGLSVFKMRIFEAADNPPVRIMRWLFTVKAQLPEENLLRRVLDQRNAGRSISTVKIRLQAKSMVEEMQITDFKGGINWVYRFMGRKNLRVRSRTTMCQAVPDDVDEKKLLSFSLQGKLLQKGSIP
ncbi:pogo transposable element with KRAB [Trichonephila clavipes]|nr:pogo transposable element with KRAB [Trichonephila clavipes]